jgi:hypothetical protein
MRFCRLLTFRSAQGNERIKGNFTADILIKDLIRNKKSAYDLDDDTDLVHFILVGDEPVISLAPY